MKYPPVDPKFYEIDAAAGMSDEEIDNDWKAYCEGMNEFCQVVDQQQVEIPKPQNLKDVLTDIISTFSAPYKKKGTHAAP